MICPLRAFNLDLATNRCQEKDCAWWITSKENQGYCAITSLAINLDDLRAEVENRAIKNVYMR